MNMDYPSTRNLPTLYSVTGNIADTDKLLVSYADLHAYVDADRAQRAAPVSDAKPVEDSM